MGDSACLARLRQYRLPIGGRERKRHYGKQHRGLEMAVEAWMTAARRFVAFGVRVRMVPDGIAFRLRCHMMICMICRRCKSRRQDL